METKKTAVENGKKPANEMTKREFFALQALNGFLSNHSYETAGRVNDFVNASVQMSDALLAELEKRNQ